MNRGYFALLLVATYCFVSFKLVNCLLLVFKLSLTCWVIEFVRQKWTMKRQSWPPPRPLLHLALFDMPNLNRFDILSISILCKIALSISIFSKITISISISISIFSELPYRYRYFSNCLIDIDVDIFKNDHINIDIDIDIFQKCRYIDNWYVISIYRTGLWRAAAAFCAPSCQLMQGL